MLEFELTTMRIAADLNVTSREVQLVHHADNSYVMPNTTKLKFAPDIALKPDPMKPFCEAAVQSKMEYRQGSAACQMLEFQTLDESATTSRSPVAFRGSDSFGNTLINLPKRVFVTFEGDPARYWLFIRCFEANILKSTADPTMRLSFLVQYSSGEAKRAIESCLIMDPEEGFTEALNILRKWFGRPHMLARAHVDALMDGPAIRPNDFATPWRLAGELRTCYTAWKQLEYESNINASRTIGALVRHLPTHTQFKWAEHAVRCMSANREQRFLDLIKFVEETTGVVDTFLSFAPRPTTGTSTIVDKVGNSRPRGPSAHILATSGSERSY
ncbi:unnamed protein product, partial [Echinostoma caproni]|uniref:MULE transposase domain-containing protein n=1 Tax=Echinostoma caproni TaxID=27848 RepID=A0A183A4I5_9TREM